jgi:hypothetical protein
MTIIVMILAGLALWGILATVLRLAADGYGRPEISSRNRGPEQLSEVPSR